MIIKVLVENTAAAGLPAEHGLCLYVEYRGKAYLIDSGATGLFAENAERMGVDLGAVEAAFLSHAHYDHAGGFPAFFGRNARAKVYLQRAAEGRSCVAAVGPFSKYIGMPKGMLEQYWDRFEFVDGAAQVAEGIFLVPHSSPGLRERAKQTHMCVMDGRRRVYDDFSHEQTVVFEEEDGLVCVSSCSHSGVDIVVEEVARTFPGRRIKAYVGGFHMMGLGGVTSCGYSRDEVRAVAGKLLGSGCEAFYSGHCTGLIAFGWLEEVLEGRLTALETGKVFEI